MGIIAIMVYRRVPAWTLIAVVVSSLLVSFAVSWTVVRLSEKKWCELMITLDEGYSAPIPGASAPTARGAKIGKDIHDLRTDRLHC